MHLIPYIFWNNFLQCFFFLNQLYLLALHLSNYSSLILVSHNPLHCFTDQMCSFYFLIHFYSENTSNKNIIILFPAFLSSLQLSSLTPCLSNSWSLSLKLLVIIYMQINKYELFTVVCVLFP